MRIALALKLRTVWAMLIAIAVLLAPAVAARASAVAPNHETQMTHMGRCSTPAPGTSSHDRDAGKTCCISICMAVAASTVAPQLQAPVRAASPIFAAPGSLSGHSLQLATPPPRLS
jgi:hypothetical protein